MAEGGQRGIVAAGRLVFISHSGRDRWIARQLARAVAEQGAVPFIDEGRIEVGSNFADELRSALEQADEFVVLWTPTAIDRPFVWLEVGIAWLRQIRIVQVRYGLGLDDLRANPHFPTFLLALDMIDINDIDVYLAELRERAGRAGSPGGPTDAES